MRVAFGREVDFGEVEARRAADRLGVDLAAAGDDDLIGPCGARRRLGERERLVDVAARLDTPSRRERAIARDDDRSSGPAAGRRSTDRSCAP